MRFWLLDAITSYEPGARLTAVKNVALTEEYLADHFPEFPVLPGVFMLEAATQASAWLLRLSEDFAHSIILLKEAKNIKYADFVPPGSTLTVDVSVVKQGERTTIFKVTGTSQVTGQAAGRNSISGRLVLERYNLADTQPHKAAIDEQLKARFRLAKNVLLSSDAMTAASA